MHVIMYMYVCVYVYLFVYTCAYLHIHVCMCACMHVLVGMCVFVHICMYILYTYTSYCAAALCCVFVGDANSCKL